MYCVKTNVGLCWEDCQDGVIDGLMVACCAFGTDVCHLMSKKQKSTRFKIKKIPL